ncbi:MAG TPA: hypothetical protein VFW07_04135 [Parafilimonas sp.]|nr:hypothetical protein [Parafilimonas sp.]
MTKHVLYLVVLLPVSVTIRCQAIYYSDNSLFYSTGYQYHIAGNVKGNIIVWKTYLEEHLKSEIFVYNNSMKLLRTINTNMLQSDIKPCLQFIVLNNSFLVFYQCKYQNTFLYKCSRFDELGNHITDEVLDSFSTVENPIVRETCFYKILRSGNNGTVCFAKMNCDSIKRVLNLNAHFISDDTVMKKDFVIQVDESRETLADIIIDDEKNILLLKGIKNDGLIKLELVKINFSGEPASAATKYISSYSFEENSLRIAEKPGGYLVFGRLGKPGDIGHMQQTRLYVWQTNNELKDQAGDTITNDRAAGDRINFTSNISNNNNLANVFATWSVPGVNSNQDIYNWYNASEQFASYKFVYPVFREYAFYYTGYIASTSIYLPPPYNKVADDYAKTDTGNINFWPKPLINKIEIFKLSSDNKIAWSCAFKDSVDNITMANLCNARAIAGHNAVHIIYEVHTSKKTTTLDHIAINADGTFSKGFIASWNSKYTYNLNNCVMTSNDELIVPAIRRGKLKFAKMKIE